MATRWDIDGFLQTPNRFKRKNSFGKKKKKKRKKRGKGTPCVYFDICHFAKRTRKDATSLTYQSIYHLSNPHYTHLHLHSHTIPSNSPPLHQEQIQRRIPQHRKHSAHHSQSRDISPKSQHIETKTAQNRTAGDLNVETVFLVNKRQVAHFIDDQAFEAEVEDGELEENVSGLLGLVSSSHGAGGREGEEKVGT